MQGAFIESIVPDYAARLAEDRIVRVAEAAKAYVWLWQQHRSAWTHELDLRPWSEAF
jgi:hypothetical protein